MPESSKFYPGNLLRVNLTDKSFRKEKVDQEVLRSFIGGRGLGAYLLYREVDERVAPLSFENKLIFTTGPLVGTISPCSGRFCVSTKSPETGVYLFSLCSGRFGQIMRKCGYDVLIVEGKSSHPVYLYIDEEKVVMEDANFLWGLDTEKTEQELHRILSGGKRLSVACIGPAGEKMLRISCIISERRAAGRGGAGAVMGSKNLKAVVVASEKGQVAVYDEIAFKKIVKKTRQLIENNSFLTEGISTFGTSVSVNLTSSFGVFPVRNWQKGNLEGIDAISPQAMKKNFTLKDKACPNCPVACSKITAVSSGFFSGAKTEGPEYETVYAFGGACENISMESIIYADMFCDKMGIDTIAGGVSIAFAMESFEKGTLTLKDTDKLELCFGNYKVIPQILEKMVKKEGPGALLCDGVKEAAAKIGQGTERFAMHAKGMELGGYDPRGIKAQALVLACGPRGGCHHAGGYVIAAELTSGRYDRMQAQGKGPLVRQARDLRAVMDSAIYCAFLASAFGLDVASELLSASVGWDVDEKELIYAGERVSNLERLYNVREGLRREDDTLPLRLLQEALPDGPSRGEILGKDFSLMLDEFYSVCGWGVHTGIPSREKIHQLRIDTFVST